MFSKVIEGGFDYSVVVVCAYRSMSIRFLALLRFWRRNKITK